MNTLQDLSCGRLGNQIFKLAFLYSKYMKYRQKFYVHRNNEPIWDYFDLSWIPVSGVAKKFYKEPLDFSLGPINPSPCAEGNHGGDRVYDGFFIDYRYIHPYKKEFREKLKFKNSVEDLPRDKPAVFVHFRRDDFVWAGHKDFWGDLYADGYYDRALAMIPQNSRLFICSDDIPWCKTNQVGKDFETVYVDRNEIDTLQLMTKADININSNSSFAFWGAYLNPQSRVIAPFPHRGLQAKASLGNAYYIRELITPEWEEVPCFQS